MNGTVIFGVIALFFILSGLINFINDLQDNVDSKSNYSSSQKSETENYYGLDSVGDITLQLNELSASQKRKIWNESTLKIEMMNFFPDFSLMSEVVEERLIDNGDFKQKLLNKIKGTEEKYIGGEMTGQRAKATLSQF